MPVVGIPDIRVVEAVHVRAELAPIDVDVPDEDGTCATYHLYHHPLNTLSELYRMWDIEVRQYIAPTGYFLF